MKPIDKVSIVVAALAMVFGFLVGLLQVYPPEYPSLIDYFLGSGGGVAMFCPDDQAGHLINILGLAGVLIGAYLVAAPFEETRPLWQARDTARRSSSRMNWPTWKP
jgi:hypothetical protein